MRVYIFGGSGCGVSTFGKGLSKRLGCAWVDTDDFYWAETEVAYTEVVPVGERVEAIGGVLDGEAEWVISGCMCSWGGNLLDRVTHAVFLTVPWEVRQERLWRRELARYGAVSLGVGGERYDLYREFVAWAGEYDEAGVGMRSRARHEAWLDEFAERGVVVRLDGVGNTVDLVEAVLALG